MQYLLLERILEEKIDRSKNLHGIIDEYAADTIALFTPPPKPFEPIIGPWAPSESFQRDQFIKKEFEIHPIILKVEPLKPIGLSVSTGSTKFFDPDVGSPLLRVDRDNHHNKPYDHLQYGSTDYLNRSGNDAYDIAAEVFRMTRRPVIFPFDEKNKKWTDY